MKNKTIYIYIFIIVFLLSVIFFMIFSDEINSRFLGASISNVSESDNIVIQAAENMIYDNIDDYDGENTITISDLIKRKYLKEKELNSKIDKKTRIIFTVEKGKIIDIYLKNRLFTDKFSCLETCYINEKKYVAFNNDIYMIMKIDKEKNVYITKGSTKIVNYDDIDSEIKKLTNKFDKNIVLSVINVSYNDIKNSNILDIDNNLYIKNNNEYQIYNFISKKFEKANDSKAGIIPIVVLKSDITYEMGDGSKFNPYIISK